MMNNVKILDCTLRDGGYYNNWDFSEKLFEKYLKAMEESKVDIVELGLRNFPKDHFLGAHAYTTDGYLSNIRKPEGMSFGVMVDAKSILTSGYDANIAIHKLFNHKSESLVDLVRIACHFGEIEKSKEIAETLKQLGYVVGLNLMQSGGKPDSELKEKAEEVSSWNCVEVLYFADSLGNMDQEEVLRITKVLQESWSGEIGFHAHNNKGQALGNSLVGIKAGITWMDATVLGMGRGAGNTPLESLLVELSHINNKPLKTEMLFKLVLEDFSILKKKYNWGSNLLYHLAANSEIHPSYIQEMMSDPRYSIEEIIKAINYIKPLPSRSFSKNLLTRAMNGANDDSEGSWDASGICSGRDVLIIGAGNSVENHKLGISNYIKANNPFVISVNTKHKFPQDLVDIFVATDISRMLMEISSYESLKKNIIIPNSRLVNFIETNKVEANTKDYGLAIKEGVFEIDKTGCVLPLPLTAGYAFSIATIGGASSIYLVGFDGYEKGDYRQDEMNELFDLYFKNKKALAIISLTPTTYSVSQSSMYAPRI